MIRRYAEGTFELPGLLVCEGAADRQFFTRLMNDRDFGHKIYVQYPSSSGDHSGGKSKFGQYLRGASISESFIKNVRAVLVVTDSDDDADASFTEIQKVLSDSDFAVPTKPGEFASLGGRPLIVGALVIPISAPGNLETICVKPLVDKWKLDGAVEKFVLASPASGWSVGKQSKMRVQSVLAATCETEPDTSFANHWHLDKKFHLPIGDESFNGICEHLRKFEALLP